MEPSISTQQASEPRRGLAALGRRATDAFGRERGLLTVVCVGAAALAQYWLDSDQRLPAAAVLYALAALLFVLLYGRQTLERAEEPPSGSAGQVSWWPVLGAIACGALAWPHFADNQFTASGTLSWAVGFALLTLAVWPRGALRDALTGQSRRLQRLVARGVPLDWHRLAFLGILAVGAFYRFYQIDQIPLEMGCDLPHIYSNIRMLLRHEFPIFFSSYPGREGLFFYLAAPFCSLFGLSHTTIKMAGSLVGLVTLPAIYLLGKELYDRRVGLVAAFMLSVSHWHIIIGRVGYRAITVPLVLTLMWYALIRALKTQRPHWFALTGLLLGLGLYTYNAFMIVPVLVVLLLLTALLTGRGRTLLTNWPNGVLLFVVAAFTFVPLGRYAYEQPTVFFYRAATRITDLETALPSDLIRTLLDTARRALLMFNYRGDGVFISNVPYLRQLGYGTAILFVLGLAQLLRSWRRGYNLTLLVVLGVMLLPTALSLAFPHEVPNAVRAIGALPAAMLVAAVGGGALWQGLAGHYAGRAPRILRLSASLVEQGEADAVRADSVRADSDCPTDEPAARGVSLRLRWSGRWLWLVVAAAAVLAEVQAVYPVYFQRYVQHLPDGNYAISLEVARAIDAFSGNGESYAKVWPYWYDGNAVRAQLRRENQSWANEITQLDAGTAPMAGPAAKFMVIVHPDDAAGLAELQAAFPRGVAVGHHDYEGRVTFITFYGERRPE